MINDDAQVNFLHPLGNSRLQYRWPDHPVELPIKIADILCKLKAALVPKRGKKQICHYELEDTCLDEIESVFLNRICRHELPMSDY